MTRTRQKALLIAAFGTLSLFCWDQTAVASPAVPEQVKQLIQTGASARALAQLDKLVDANPDCAAGHYWRGKALFKLGRKKEASDEFEIATLLEPGAEFASDAKKQILSANSAKSGMPERAGAKSGQAKSSSDKVPVFRLSDQRSRVLNQVSGSLRRELNAEISDLRQLAMGGSASRDDFNDAPVSPNPPSPPGPVLPAGISTELSHPSPANMPVKDLPTATVVPVPRYGSKRGIIEIPQSDKVAEEAEFTADDLPVTEFKLSAIERLLLSNSDLIFVVDHSGSMRTRDCPQRFSRWSWVQAQIKQMGEDTKDCLKRGVSAVFFDNNAEEFRSVSSKELLRLFDGFSPAGGTNTAHAFRTQAENVRKSLAAGHPVVIVAITDGLPQSRFDLNQSIQELETIASRQRGKLKIAFMQIGASNEGLETLQGLKDMLSARNRDMVHVHSFAELKENGLTKTIMSELK